MLPSRSIYSRSYNLNQSSVRYLFKNASKKLELYNQKQEQKKKDKNDIDHEPFHHEYSIRPDTYAFKVINDIGRKSSSSKDVQEPTSHPFQRESVYTSKRGGFNLIEFIYRYTTNYPFGDKSPQMVYNEYPRTNSETAARLKIRPKGVKMTTANFIEDSLYNPNYGYFSREVNIYQPDKPFDYNNIEDIDDFMENWNQSYKKYDNSLESAPKQYQNKNTGVTKVDPNAPPPLPPSKDALTSKFVQRAQLIHKQDTAAAMASSKGVNKTRRSLQLWHTPTELFQPYYGEAIARHILVNYKLNGSYPYEDLIIYEMGGGNGTLMCNILNFIRKHQPDVYDRTQYKIIEISSQLALKQVKSALNNKLIKNGLDTTKVEIINKSIFKWDKVILEPCFFLALEVFDNFAHDVVRYDNTTGEPYEGQVLIDKNGDFFEFFTPELSYYTNAYLQLREHGDYSVLKESNRLAGRLETFKSLIPFLTDKDKIHPLLHSSLKLRWQNSLFPFKDNLTPPEFIPTRLLQFFQILKHKFPNHSLLCSDFHYLPKVIKGSYNGPVVQTVVQDKTVDVSTYMCHQGYFDIMFATDFGIAADLYRQVTGKIPKVESHKQYLEQWADTDATTTKAGENPMLDFYKNVSFMSS
ncbi:S-adenosyl-L-methionine-dependent methyltransferase [Scheffersomyces coipomensis]|uniref:S-adenosyl-L-methionine-dependent methyltransferase n=1 Tax=Scheffersomyces coipomensis TaxID=1788519 RepID=UPI00315D9980